jgi:hypothetical protein
MSRQDLRAHAVWQRESERVAEERALPRQFDPERELRVEVARLTKELEAARRASERRAAFARFAALHEATTVVLGEKLGLIPYKGIMSKNAKVRAEAEFRIRCIQDHVGRIARSIRALAPPGARQGEDAGG